MELVQKSGFGEGVGSGRGGRGGRAGDLRTRRAWRLERMQQLGGLGGLGFRSSGMQLRFCLCPSYFCIWRCQFFLAVWLRVSGYLSMWFAFLASFVLSVVSFSFMCSLSFCSPAPPPQNPTHPPTHSQKISTVDAKDSAPHDNCKVTDLQSRLCTQDIGRCTLWVKDARITGWKSLKTWQRLGAAADTLYSVLMQKAARLHGHAARNSPG